MRVRIFLSIFIVVLLYAGLNIYDALQGPIEGSAAVGQLSDEMVGYGASRAVAGGLLRNMISLVALLILAAIWVPVFFRKNHPQSHSTIILPIIAIGLLGISGCGPYQQEIVEEIKPNETAFLVPLEGATKDTQGKFMSIEYLNQAKVATKRVTVPTRRRDVGRKWNDYEWIPTMKLIVVDRTPQTRKWTMGSHTGTTEKMEALCVESQESISFCVGATAMAAVTEEDAAKFLYNYSGKPLALVMDQDIHGFVGSLLSREFGKRTLDDGRKNKAIIFVTVFQETKDFFSNKGVTILQTGSTEGLVYQDSKVQQAINDTFVAENDKIKAANEKEAQAQRNEITVGIAIAARRAAEEFAKAQEAQTAKLRLDIEMKRAEAMLAAAQNLKDLKGQLPSVMPEGSTLLFGLDKPFGETR